MGGHLEQSDYKAIQTARILGEHGLQKPATPPTQPGNRAHALVHPGWLKHPTNAALMARKFHLSLTTEKGQVCTGKMTNTWLVQAGACATQKPFQTASALVFGA